MDNLAKVASVMILCMVVIAPLVEAAITCGFVLNSLSPCLNYLTGRGTLVPACCNGIRGLNNAAKTTPDRQAACRCLVSIARSIKGIDFGKANKLPGQCGVNIPYQISPNTNCSKIH